MSKDALDLVGIGNAIVDVLSRTPDSFLQVQSIQKGAMTLIEEEQADKLYGQMPPGTEMSGGSAANTVAAFAAMGGKAGYIGKVANDQLGKVFSHDIRASGVSFNTKALEEGPPTARCLIMVTPDAQRTMCTYLGASVWISPTDLDEEMIKTAKVTYLEGYLFDRPRAKETFKKACEIAHAAGRKVALSLSDSFCVNRHRDEFLDLVKGHVDIVFANEAEILALYSEKDLNVALHYLRDDCDVGAVTLSEKGSVIVCKTAMIDIHPIPVAKVIDTTGAGDMYAAGFLYGYTQGLPLAECGQIASIAASEVIAHMGARPQTDLAQIVKDRKQA